MNQEDKFQKILDSCPDIIQAWHSPTAFGVEWSIKGKGFGGISFTVKQEGEQNPDSVPLGKLVINAERESKEFVKWAICKAIDEGELIG